MSEGWTTADYALIISLFSACLALAAFFWNVWSKFIFPKPKVQVTARVGYFDRRIGYILYEHHDGTLPGEVNRKLLGTPVLSIHATNFGPGIVTLSVAVARRSKLIDRSIRAVGLLNPYKNFPNDLSSDGPASGGLPIGLNVGEEFTAFFPLTSEWFTRDRLVKFGFLDTFRRTHYCSASDVRALRRAAFREAKEARE